MLMKITGEPVAVHHNALQPRNSIQQSTHEMSDLEMMPELAFDFSFPFNSDDISFDPPYMDAGVRPWSNGVPPADILASR